MESRRRDAAARRESRAPSVGILGGGSAGYLTALALRAKVPAARVTLIESSEVPILGVGEATTPIMAPFLHSYLGIGIEELYRDVRPTWKLGVKLFWGGEGDDFFNFPFDAARLAESYAYSGDINRCSLGSLLMTSDRGPILRRESGALVSLLQVIPFAYHLDNRRFVAFLHRRAEERDVRRVDARIAEVELAAENTVAALVSEDGRRFSFDLYVDCSGFRSRLLGEALGTPFVSYSDSLATDRALVADVPHSGPFGSHTYAETMQSGWCWRIPEQSALHRGYVYSSAFATEQQALDEMRERNPTMEDPWQVTFEPGRRTDWWRGNVVAVGNAYGFVEPLESTALHMVVREIALLVSHLREDRDDPEIRARLGAGLGGSWDYLRDHLALHYRFNRKLDTPFWRRCRETIPLHSLESVVAHALEHGPQIGGRGSGESPASYVLPSVADETDLLLLGQKVIPASRVSPSEPRHQWQERQARLTALRDLALPSRFALEQVLERPELADASAAGWYQALLRDLEEPTPAP